MTMQRGSGGEKETLKTYSASETSHCTADSRNFIGFVVMAQNDPFINEHKSINESIHHFLHYHGKTSLLEISFI